VAFEEWCFLLNFGGNGESRCECWLCYTCKSFVKNLYVITDRTVYVGTRASV